MTCLTVTGLSISLQSQYPSSHILTLYNIVLVEGGAGSSMLCYLGIYRTAVLDRASPKMAETVQLEASARSSSTFRGPWLPGVVTVRNVVTDICPCATCGGRQLLAYARVCVGGVFVLSNVCAGNYSRHIMRSPQESGDLLSTFNSMC